MRTFTGSRHHVHYNHIRYDFAVTQARYSSKPVVSSRLQWHISKDKGASRVCGLTLLRTKKGEHLAFAFADASAKRDISTPTSALKEVVVTKLTTVTVVSLTGKGSVSRLCISETGHKAHPLVPRKRW